MKTNRFKYLIAAIVPMMAIASPLHAQQKSESVSTVSLKSTSPDDDNETTKPNAYQLFGHGDPKLDSISKQTDHYSNMVYNYDHSKAYETLTARAKGFSHDPKSFYDNDTMRNIMAGVDRISKDFKAHMGRELSLKRDSLGRLIGDYFKTQKFVQFNTKLQKKYNIDPAKSYTSDNADYKRYHAELMQNMPDNIKNDLQQLKALGEESRARLQSPQYVADIKQLHLLLDSMKSYIKKQHTKQYTYASYEATMDVPADERKKAQEELRVYLQSPDFRSGMDKWNEYATVMRDYYKSNPAVKQHEDAWKNELKTILADDYNSILHPGEGLGYLFTN
jgi:hypothetical protein